MIVLGNSHQFTSLELKSINVKPTNIDFIADINIGTNKIIEQLDQLICNSKEKQIIINIDGSIDDKLLAYLTKVEQKQSITFSTIENFLEKSLHKVHIPKKHSDISFLEQVKPCSLFSYIQKRAIDYIGIASLFTLFWPIMLYSAYRIKKESPDGGILFKQDRVGLSGREFTCIKFRSMRSDAEKDGAQFAVEDDSRVFPWGKVMRKTRIDELPQIFNVLKGEMHLIGPRPERRVWVDQFIKEIPYYNKRHLVKPGITGWAQVKYPYGANIEDARQKLMYDLYYIKEWSLLLDLKTIILTVMVVLGHRGR